MKKWLISLLVLCGVAFGGNALGNTDSFLSPPFDRTEREYIMLHAQYVLFYTVEFWDSLTSKERLKLFLGEAEHFSKNRRACNPNDNMRIFWFRHGDSIVVAMWCEKII